jgi:uncharacterized protein (DUF305 family)
MSTKLLHGTLALTLSFLTAAASFAAQESPDPMARMLQDKSGADFEAAFLALMIQHHQEGVKMAKMAQPKAQNAELKKMIPKMAADQQGEIDQMTAWLKEWYKKAPSDYKMPDKSMQMMKKDMEQLQDAQGEKFDRMFAQKMAHHHVGAIEMGRQAATKAEHKEVKQLAQRIASSQSKERDKLLKVAGGEHDKH